MGILKESKETLTSSDENYVPLPQITGPFTCPDSGAGWDNKYEEPPLFKDKFYLAAGFNKVPGCKNKPYVIRDIGGLEVLLLNEAVFGAGVCQDEGLKKFVSLMFAELGVEDYVNTEYAAIGVDVEPGEGFALRGYLSGDFRCRQGKSRYLFSCREYGKHAVSEKSLS